MADNRTHIVISGEDQSKGAFASAQASLQGLERGAAGAASLLKSLVPMFSVGAAVSFVKSTIDSADAMNDMATRTGTSVEALASYELAARQSGTSVESLAQAMGKLSVYMGKNADEAAALGITAKDPAQAFAQLADVIGSVEDPAQRNALAMKVLGKSYAEVMPLLAQGGDALRAQADASGPYAERMAKLAKSADEFNDSLAAVGQAAQSALLPLVNTLTDAFNAAGQATEGLEGMEAALTGLGTFGTVGQTLAVTWANVAYVFERTGNEIGGIAAQIAALARGDFEGAALIGDAMKKDAEKARAELDALEQRIMRGPGTRLQSIGGNRYAGETDFIKAQEKAIADLGKQYRDVSHFLDGEEAGKLQANLAKAFDTKALDDYLDKFQDRRQKIVKEYDRLKADLNAEPIGENTTSVDLSYELTQGRGAITRGDSTGAEIAAERARKMLDQLRAKGDTGLGYYADQIKQYELAMLDAEQKTATSAAESLKKSLDQAAAEVAKMSPLVLPLATDAIANDLRATIDAMRKELAANPLMVPVVATDPRGIYAPDVRTAATAVGGR